VNFHSNGDLAEELVDGMRCDAGNPPHQGWGTSRIEEINFEIKRRFEGEGIEMAYPTQTLHLVKKSSNGD
jgi:hypothetical protein